MRPATNEDVDAAPYVIRGSAEDWQQVLEGRLDPIMALMQGKLKLQNGGLIALARYGAAAKQLVVSARRVNTDFSGEETQEVKKTDGRPMPLSAHETFATTSARGLRYDILPMRLYQKAKKLGIWNPQEIDFRRDTEDWQRLDDLQKEALLHLSSLFLAGEESVTLDLLPLIMVIAKEGRLEEEMYLTTFLWEEAKHTEFFRRFLDEVAHDASELSRFHGPNYRRIFYEELPTAMNALLTDTSPAAQIRASVTYNMIVEGTLAETGYHAYYAMLERNNLMPGLREGIHYLKRDESRHITYGIFLLSRLVAADATLWNVVEKRMSEMLELALATINEIYDRYETVPFGLRVDDFIDFALVQFNKRLTRIERAKEQTLEEIYPSPT